MLGMSGVLVDEHRATELHNHIHQWLPSVETSRPAAQKILNKSRFYSADSYKKLTQRYGQAYPEPVTILPPDRYGDIVVQPAVGCPNRKCSFCAFYQDKPYRVLDAPSLSRHLDAISELYGSEIASRSGVFLGSANAMALSQRRLAEGLEMIGERFGALERGVATFADPDYSARRQPVQWLELRKLGLCHLVIGLETGWGELRARLGKSGDLEKVLASVLASREAGMTVGLTLLVGACPSIEQRENVDRTIALIEGMGLGRKDIVYLSPLSQGGVVSPDASHEQLLYSDRLRQVTPARIVPYQMQRFHYYA